MRGHRQLPASNPLPGPSGGDVANLAVECVADAWRFTALRQRWNQLLRDSDSDNPFLTWEWLNAWWVHLAGTSRLRVIVVRDGSELIAIAPMRLVTAPWYWFSRLEFLGTGDAGSDYLDLIVRRGRARDALPAIAQFLGSQQLTTRLTHLPPASASAQLAQLLAGEGWGYSAVDDGVCPIVKLAGHTFDSFLDSLGSSHRANIRRRIRALERKFDVRFERVTSQQTRQNMLTALARFHEVRYAGRGGSTAFSTPALRAFHEEATRHALDRDWLRMYVLRLDGAVAAIMYGFHYGGRFYFYQHGYDEEYATHSVGLVLMALTIRAAIDDGADEFDMLWGVESYKSLWTRESRVLQRAELFPLDVGGTVHRHAIEARRGVSQLARRVLSLGFPGAPRGA